jgi:hypothetical protein
MGSCTELVETSNCQYSGRPYFALLANGPTSRGTPNPAQRTMSFPAAPPLDLTTVKSPNWICRSLSSRGKLSWPPRQPVAACFRNVPVPVRLTSSWMKLLLSAGTPLRKSDAVPRMRKGSDRRMVSEYGSIRLSGRENA